MFNKNFEDNLKDVFMKEEITPDKDWTQKTLHNLNVLADNDTTTADFTLTNYNNYFAFMTRRNMILGGISITVLAALTLLTAIVIFNRLNVNSRIKSLSLSDSELSALYERIADANPTFSSEAQFRSVAADAQTAGASLNSRELASSYMADSKLIAPYFGEENVLYKNTYSTTYGAGIEACGTMNYNGTYSNGQTEVVESATIQSAGYINSVSSTKDGSGRVYNYYLNLSNANSNTNINYAGGQYAVRMVYPAAPVLDSRSLMLDTSTTEGGVSVDSEGLVVETMPAPIDDFPMPELSNDPVERIRQLFGENAQVIGTVNENGQEFYIVESSSDLNCDETNFRALTISSKIPEATNRMIQHYQISSVDYKVVKTTAYLDSATDDRLISSSTTSEISTPVSGFDEVASQFTFPFNVEIRDIEVPDYSQENEINKTREYINSQNLAVLKPVGIDVTASSVYVYDSREVVDPYSYYQDRDFYPQGALGDKVYESATAYLFQYDPNEYYEDGSYYPSALGSMYYNNADYTKSFNINFYKDEGRNLDNLVATIKNGKKEISETPVSIVVDGQNVLSTLFTYTYDNMFYAEGSEGSVDGEMVVDPVLPSDVTTQTTYEVVFKLNGFIYQLSGYSTNESFDPTSVTYQRLSSAELEAIFQTMTASYNGDIILY